MASPYRIKEMVSSNVPADIRIAGTFSLTTGGAPGALVRPSAGSQAAAGQGNLFTVTQLGSYGGLTAANVYQVTLTETYWKSVACDAQYQYPFSLALSTSGFTVDCFATPLDPTTNSFLIFLTTPAGVITSSLNATITTGQIGFEVICVNTTSPNTL